MPSPPRGPVPTRISLRTRSGACSEISCATMPPIEKPSISALFEPRARLKATALAPICSNVVGTSPELLETPALSNKITSRSRARALAVAPHLVDDLSKRVPRGFVGEEIGGKRVLGSDGFSYPV